MSRATISISICKAGVPQIFTLRASSPVFWTKRDKFFESANKGTRELIRMKWAGQHKRVEVLQTLHGFLKRILLKLTIK